jgi:hypothetical protein
MPKDTTDMSGPNELHDALDKAHAKLIVVRDSCEAVSNAQDSDSELEGFSYPLKEKPPAGRTQGASQKGGHDGIVGDRHALF